MKKDPQSQELSNKTQVKKPNHLEGKQQPDPMIIQQQIKTVNGQIYIKRYKKIKKVGEGSYSKCYLVQTLDSDSNYVVKVIPKSKLEILAKQKLLYEIKIQRMLAHKNVVHLDHWYEDNKNQYIFMQYCSKGNLETRMNQLKGYSEDDIRFYGLQISKVIQYVHSKNVLHRDLKLCNFYLDENDNIKIGDFGFACQLSHPNQLRRQSCGTPNYIAPEAISGFGYNFTSDIWGIGVMLYRMKFKICPFEAPSIAQTLENVKLARYKFPDQKISKQLKDLIERILVVNYDDRLTCQDIINHEFFDNVSDTRLVKKQKKGFSLKRLFSIGKNKEPEESKPKRSNSCETLKQIKQIIKNKTSNCSNLPSEYTQHTLNSMHNSTYYPISNSIRQSKVTQRTSGTTKRQEAQTKFSKGQQFIKHQHHFNSIKQQFKQQKNINQEIKTQKFTHQNHNFENMNKKTPEVKNNKVQSSLLAILTHKYSIPYKITINKDIFILYYQNNFQQIIHGKQAYLLSKTKNYIYDRKGCQIQKQQIPKVIKYVIQHNINFEELNNSEDEPDQFATFSQDLTKQIDKLAENWIITKEGIILQYKNSLGDLTYCVKMNNQQYLYVNAQKIGILFNETYGVVDGVVLQRLFLGFLKSNIKQ